MLSVPPAALNILAPSVKEEITLEIPVSFRREHTASRRAVDDQAYPPSRRAVLQVL